jgi:hypothetical protein
MFLLSKEHAHRESLSNFIIEYDTYEEAFDSVVDEALGYDEYIAVMYNKAVFNSNRGTIEFNEEINDYVYDLRDAEFCFGDTRMTIGDFNYTIEEVSK